MQFPSLRNLMIGAVLIVLTANVVALSWSISAMMAQVSEVPDSAATEKVVKAYIEAHPELVRDALVALLKQPEQKAAGREAAETLAESAAPTPDEVAKSIEANADLLFRSPRQVTLGNLQGDVTLVEFFDYNCGFCKRALPDMLALLKNDPKLKIALKEYPILGQGSEEAARVGIAIQMQDPSGKHYAAYHETMLSSHGQANKESALAAATSLGLDVAQIKRDMTSDTANKTIAENMRLADALGIAGTPNYVIDRLVVEGAVGEETLKELIAGVRGRAG